MARPERVTVRMYQVGFGDCFLVSFAYKAPLADGRSERHMLIDFGMTHAPRGVDRGRAAEVIERAARLIARHTNGQLDVVVNTHRHRDHLSGFGDARAGPIIAALKPRLVVRPWTDDPAVAADATVPHELTDRGHVTRLAAGQRLAELVEGLSRSGAATGHRAKLEHLAFDQIPNPAAIAFLETIGARAEARFPSAGQPSGIEEHIPGIRVRVLGPPTLEQLPGIAGQRANDPDEFWLGQCSALHGLAAGTPATSREPPTNVPAGPVGWLVDRLNHQQAGSLLRIVRTVDDALNNTSLILLLDAGDKRLLFPGDAQIENWSWALEHAEDAAALRGLLAGVDLYKVGHHGSRNATPKSLFGLWGPEPDPARPMMALMSTMPGVHGRSDATAVPRSTLVEALAHRMKLVRTDGFAKATGFAAVSAPTTGGSPFTLDTQEPDA
jgi:hypothetical protein